MDATSVRLQPGGNNPPTPFEDIQTRINDLYDEAKLWLDGDPIDTQVMADAVNAMIVQIREAEKEADALRKEEVKPFDDGKAEVQTRYNVLIGNTKSVKGKTVLALEVAKKALTPWLIKLDDEKREIERIARAEADAAREAAEIAFQESRPDDLAARDAAEHLLDEAREVEAIANRAAKDTAKAKGGTGRATSLRTYYRGEITDKTAFASFLWTNRQSEMDGFLAEMAKKIADTNPTAVIPGLVIHTEKRAV